MSSTEDSDPWTGINRLLADARKLRDELVTIGQIQNLPQFAKDLHIDLMGKFEASRKRLVSAKERAEGSARKLDSISAAYERAADEIDDLERQLSNAPLSSSNE